MWNHNTNDIVQLFDWLSSRYGITPDIRSEVEREWAHRSDGFGGIQRNGSNISLSNKVGDSEIKGIMESNLSITWNVGPIRTAVNVVFEKCHATVRHSAEMDLWSFDDFDDFDDFSASPTSSCTPPPNVTLEVSEVNIELSDSALSGNQWKLLVLVYGLEFLGILMHTKASVLKIFTGKEEFGLCRKLVRTGNSQWVCDYFRWKGLMAEKVEAMSAGEKHEKLFISFYSVMSLPQWVGWHLTRPVPRIDVAVLGNGDQGKNLEVIVPTIIEVKDVVGGFELLGLLRALTSAWGFSSAVFSVNGIHFIKPQQEEGGYGMEWGKVAAKFDCNDMGQWEFHVTVEAVLIPECIRLSGLSVSGTLEGDGSIVHVLHVEMDQISFNASESNIALLQNLLNNLSQKTGHVLTPYAYVGNISSEIRMEDIVTDAAAGLPWDEITAWEGSFESTTCAELWAHYGEVLEGLVNVRKARSSDTKTSITDTLVAGLGRAAVGAAITHPVGMLVSMGALGVKDGVSHMASVGKSSRGVSSDSNYRVGDVSRGVIASLTRSNSSNDSIGSEEQPLQEAKKTYFQENKARYGGMGGATIGATIGLSILGGPVGLVAGSMLGSATVKNAIQSSEKKKDQQEREEMGGDVILTTQESVLPSEEVQQQGYKFGDFTRSAIARGKKASGRDENSSYKFGDFTRGLFSSS